MNAQMLFTHVRLAAPFVKARLELDNAAMRLRPEMFVEVNIVTGGARRLTVPAEAVLDSGVTRTVFLDRGNGNFEPRVVKVGEQTDNRVEILSGLQAGDRIEILKGLTPAERIVTSATFLLESETQMKSWHRTPGQ